MVEGKYVYCIILYFSKYIRQMNKSPQQVKQNVENYPPGRSWISGFENNL